MRKDNNRHDINNNGVEKKQNFFSSFFSQIKEDFKNGIKALKRNTKPLKENSMQDLDKITQNQKISKSYISIFKKRTKERSFLVSVLLVSVFLVILAISFIGFSGLGAIFGIANAYVYTTPVLDLAKIENLSESSFIYDSNGEYITTFSGLENRIYVWMLIFVIARKRLELIYMLFRYQSAFILNLNRQIMKQNVIILLKMD